MNITKHNVTEQNTTKHKNHNLTKHHKTQSNLTKDHKR